MRFSTRPDCFMSRCVGAECFKSRQMRKSQTSGLGTKALPGMVKQLRTELRYCAMMERRLLCLLPVLAVNLWVEEQEGG